MSNYFYQQASTRDYMMEINHEKTVSYSEQEFRMLTTNQNKSKIEKFKERLDEFKNVVTLRDAKALLKKIMPVNKEKTIFRIDNAKCTVINKEKSLKIILKTGTEHITYYFV